MVAGPVVSMSCRLCCHLWPPRCQREVVRYWLSGFRRLFSQLFVTEMESLSNAGNVFWFIIALTDGHKVRAFK